MAKFFTLALASTLLAGSAVAHEGHEANSTGSSNSTTTVTVGSSNSTCSDEINREVLAVVDNSTYLNTCSPGSTWKLTSLFEAANLSQTDFFTFCNATNCMHPMHELIDDANLPECSTTYRGQTIVWIDALNTIHNSCHKLLHQVEGSTEDGGDHDLASSTSGSNKSASKPSSSVPSPTPTSVAASSKTIAAAIALTASIAAFVL